MRSKEESGQSSLDEGYTRHFQILIICQGTQNIQIDDWCVQLGFRICYYEQQFFCNSCKMISIYYNWKLNLNQILQEAKEIYLI